MGLTWAFQMDSLYYWENLELHWNSLSIWIRILRLTSLRPPSTKRVLRVFQSDSLKMRTLTFHCWAHFRLQNSLVVWSICKRLNTYRLGWGTKREIPSERYQARGTKREIPRKSRSHFRASGVWDFGCEWRNWNPLSLRVSQVNLILEFSFHWIEFTEFLQKSISPTFPMWTLGNLSTSRLTMWGSWGHPAGQWGPPASLQAIRKSPYAVLKLSFLSRRLKVKEDKVSSSPLNGGDCCVRAGDCERSRSGIPKIKTFLRLSISLNGRCVHI